MRQIGFFPRQQRGVSLITAIFMLLLFAALAAFMASLLTTEHATSAQDVESARALQAARMGAEWGLYQLDPNGSAAGLPGCFAASSLLQYAGYTVEVSCSVSIPYTEGSRTIRIYSITSTATNGAGAPPRAVERQLNLTVEKCRDSAIVAPFDC